MIPPLVIGYGNTLRGDDGAGVAAALRVREVVPHVDVLVVHELQPELVETLSQRRCVIFLDAVTGADALVCTPLDSSSSPSPVDSHLFTPAQLIALSRSLYGRAPKSVFLVGIPASDFSYTEGISPASRKYIEECVETVRRLADASLPG
jgi:hydrogenase maturation protease